MKRMSLVAVAVAAALLTGCGPAPQDQGTAPAQRGIERTSRDNWNSSPPLGASRVTGQGRDAARAEFLNRIRNADPQFQTIERALINERNELGIILDRNVDLESIPALMRSLLTQMAQKFPGEDLTVIAYAPSDPPLKIGTGRLDARSREMTYTAAQ